MTLRGQVKNGVVVFQNGSTVSLPDGTLVEVTPLPSEGGNSLAVIAAMEAEPHLSPEDVAELERAIAAGKRPAAAMDPFANDLPVSKERQEALLGLIGMWKVEHPPNDEEVERIIEEERMKKYG
jgi:hypothetical protein